MKMCTKFVRTPVILVCSICFVIVLVAICGITLINNLNLSNIIRLNAKVASDSANANDKHSMEMHEFNYIDNHPRNINLPKHQVAVTMTVTPPPSSTNNSDEHIKQQATTGVSHSNAGEFNASLYIPNGRIRDHFIVEEATSLYSSSSMSWPSTHLNLMDDSGDISSLKLENISKQQRTHIVEVS